MTEPTVTKQKKPHIKTYVATTGIIAVTAFSIWFMRSCGPEPIMVLDKAKAPCGCNQVPSVDTFRVAGPRTGPLGIWRRDSIQVKNSCKPDTTKCPDSNAHRDTIGDCACDSGYHNEAKAPDLKCVKNIEPCSAPHAHHTRSGDCGCNDGYHNEAKAPDLKCVKNPTPCGCPDDFANDVRQSIVDAVKVIALRRSLVHDDKSKIPVIDASFVVKPSGSNGVVVGPAQFKAKCPGGCDDTNQLASNIPAGVEGMHTELPPGDKPCTRRFIIPLPP